MLLKMNGEMNIAEMSVGKVIATTELSGKGKHKNKP